MNRAPALAARIDRLAEVAAAEPRLDGVVLYGSWTLGEADEHSDVEAYVFVRDEHAADFDGDAFLARVAPLALACTNSFGVRAVVFDDLMRGEFHFGPAGPGIAAMAGWRGLVHFPEPERAVLLDRSGRLTEQVARLAEFVPPEPGSTARQRVDELTNWTLLLAHLLDRGETARAHAALTTLVAPHQLQLCRLLRGSTRHWLTPSRALEADLPAADQVRYTTTTAAAEPDAIRAAARESWRWSRELAGEAEQRWGVAVPHELHARITHRLDP
ncbi:nucleotidyltransferase domain-containing protein [Saccharopolyspora cebuensis]|uniref:Nucleotidyltransferase domain-containing protein n=1 Tax=Saccharopolyspora cebuensis TaxID=418759 RepID=A0ABV4CNA2_9PSEU